MLIVQLEELERAARAVLRGVGLPRLNVGVAQLRIEIGSRGFTELKEWSGREGHAFWGFGGCCCRSFVDTIEKWSETG